MMLNWSYAIICYADGGLGEVFESTKHFWIFRGKQRCYRYLTQVLADLVSRSFGESLCAREPELGSRQEDTVTAE